MKKKLITMLTGAAMAASLFAAPQVLAADQQQDRLQLKDQTCEYFVDEDQDGICDNINEGSQLQKRDGSGNPAGQALGRKYQKGPQAGSLHFDDRESVTMTRQGACWAPGSRQAFGVKNAEKAGKMVQTRAKSADKENAPAEARQERAQKATPGTGDQDRVRDRVQDPDQVKDQLQKRDQDQLKDPTNPDCDGTGEPILKQDGTGGKGARRGK